jgi:hypothetical protein
MMVQNRCYAALGWDKEVREICKAHDIIYQGFSLLTANVEFITGPEIRSIAMRLGTGPHRSPFASPCRLECSVDWDDEPATYEGRPSSRTADTLR